MAVPLVRHKTCDLILPKITLVLDLVKTLFHTKLFLHYLAPAQRVIKSLTQARTWLSLPSQIRGLPNQ